MTTDDRRRPPLRAVMEAGGRPAEVGDDARLRFLVEAAMRSARNGPMNPDLRRHLEQVADADVDAAGRLEVDDDPEVRKWLTTEAPPALLAALALSDEAEERPFPLVAGDGLYRCSGCGLVALGPHARMLDVGGLLDGSAVTLDDFRWCAGCLLVVQ